MLTHACVLFSTIGKLEPSYVIRKFLDAQRIHNLTAYLQALHRQSLPNADHTTLLLNCYTKLKDSSKLEEFIKVCIYIPIYQWLSNWDMCASQLYGVLKICV